MEAPIKQKPLDSTTIAEDINQMSLLLRKHLLGTEIKEPQVHAAVHQTQAESQAQTVRGLIKFFYVKHVKNL